MNNVNEMVYWITERWNIHQKRILDRPPPWTNDPILANYRFCNVHRENDRVTKWIRENWPLTDYPEASFTLARMLNQPYSLQKIIPMVKQWDWDLMGRALKHERNKNNKIFNPAYIVSTCGQKMDKIDYVLDVVRTVHDTYFNTPSCEECSDVLQTVNGLGSFLAGQVVADLKNSPGHHLYTAEDKHTFVVPGPGSLRGLGWLMGHKVTKTHFSDYFNQAYATIVPQVMELPAIDAQDFQNCLCEFDKFMRARTGTGKPKQKYVQHT